MSELQIGAPPAIAIEGVRKVFRNDLLKGKQIAVEGLTCHLPQGRCTGLLGHNGAGKTTTIRMILGLVKPDQGQILFEGRPLATKDRRFIGYMPEVNKLPQGLTPEEILSHQLILCAQDRLSSAARKTKVAETLEKVDLARHRRKRIGHLSKGMARRLAWAQATIHGPKLLILDEPASGLDPLARKRMLAWIEDEKLRGTSILLCTHELQQVSTLCDQVYVLRRGKLVFRGERGGTSWRERYVVHVAGLDDSMRQALEQEGHLPKPQTLVREKFLLILSFSTYGDAARWLEVLLAKGYVVPKFADESGLDEDELLAQFQGEG